jgi:hypothetical protein
MTILTVFFSVRLRKRLKLRPTLGEVTVGEFLTLLLLKKTVTDVPAAASKLPFDRAHGTSLPVRWHS